jgi:hypothetical protein
MEVVLNIGLARNGKPNLTTRDAIAALEANNFWPISTEVFQSDTEPTLVAVVDAHRAARLFPMRAGLFNVSVALEQDCIGALANNVGRLIGPRAAAWGEFNPEFFIMPDGTRLASPAAKAA